MCVVSMITEYYGQEWPRKYPTIPAPPYIDWSQLGQVTKPAGPTPEEVEEFRKLLDRAREYDKRNNEPDCEMESKKAALRELAKVWGIDISFIDKV